MKHIRKRITLAKARRLALKTIRDAEKRRRKACSCTTIDEMHEHPGKWKWMGGV